MDGSVFTTYKLYCILTCHSFQNTCFLFLYPAYFTDNNSFAVTKTRLTLQYNHNIYCKIDRKMTVLLLTIVPTLILLVQENDVPERKIPVMGPERV